jgi:serine/threonine protein kinase
LGYASDENAEVKFEYRRIRIDKTGHFTQRSRTKQKNVTRNSYNYTNRRKKITVKDFEPLSIIGRGAFGEVRICKYKETGEVVAMKKMKKSEMLYKN